MVAYMPAQEFPPAVADGSGKDDFILDDICDLDAIAQTERDYEARLCKQVLQEEQGSQFPDLVLEGTPYRWRPQDTSGAQESQPGVSQTPFFGGLLGQLRDQAQTVREQQAAHERQRQHWAAQLDQSLRQVFAYLHDLVQQLNVLQPDIPRVYPLAEQSLQGLAWRQGYTDYRTSSLSERAFMELVSLNYHLIGHDEQPIMLERDGDMAETFRQRLFDFNLNMQVEEKRDERNFVESIRIHIKQEVKVSVRWEPDYREGTLRVFARNLERLGYTTYRLPADAPMNLAVLEEFGRMVLGHPHRFPHIARHPAS
jgi:hypothetical protein